MVDYIQFTTVVFSVSICSHSEKSTPVIVFLCPLPPSLDITEEAQCRPGLRQVHVQGVENICPNKRDKMTTWKSKTGKTVSGHLLAPCPPQRQTQQIGVFRHLEHSEFLAAHLLMYGDCLGTPA